MKTKERKTWRVAIVWMDDTGRFLEMLQAVYEEAEAAKGISLLQLPAGTARFDRDVLRPLKLWPPDGVLVNMLDWKRLESLRHQLPGVPFVACQYAPEELVDSRVVMDGADALRVAVEYFQRQGIRTPSLYFSGTRRLEPVRLEGFHAAVPGGSHFSYYHEDQQRGTPRQVPRRDGGVDLEYPHEEFSPQTRALRAWLRRLPKPAGVVTVEIWAGGFLLAQCRHAGLRVPEQVQVIGLDDPEACLQCHPRLTSLTPPWSRMGETAVQTLWRHLQGEELPPIVRVSTSTLAVRETTQLVSVGTGSADATLQLADEWAVRGVSVKRLAQLAGMSRTTFFEQFTAASGQTPARYLREKRMAEAGRMLRESDASVAAIAKKCGFSTVQTFSRSFRQATGQTPSAYRRSEVGGSRR